MEIITMILSGLALLAAVLCLILIFREKKRNEKRNAAALQYTDTTVQKIITEMGAQHTEAMTTLKDAFQIKMQEHEGKIKNLEQGIVPDYNEALQAKKSVDLFNEGIANILNYNPMEAARKAREERQFGGRVE